MFLVGSEDAFLMDIPVITEDFLSNCASDGFIVLETDRTSNELVGLNQEADNSLDSQATAVSSNASDLQTSSTPISSRSVTPNITISPIRKQCLRTRGGSRTRGARNQIIRTKRVATPVNCTAQNSVSDSNVDDDWVESNGIIPDFHFDSTSSGPRDPVTNDCFELVKRFWSEEIMDCIVESTNTYMLLLHNSKRPVQKNSRTYSCKPTNKEEMWKFIGLLMLASQNKKPRMRLHFSVHPFYYSPIFSHIMSGRRFELLLRCFSCDRIPFLHPEKVSRAAKVQPVMDLLLDNFQTAYFPKEQLSLDESLLLWRGRLVFRQYIKNKKKKYGIKFYELCESDGYILNFRMYTGKGAEGDEHELRNMNSLVKNLMRPYLNKGHHLYMDNFYNSVSLSEELLKEQTHSTGTLRSNRIGNPKSVTSKDLKKGEQIWRKNVAGVYVSKWKDKRDVLTLTTAHRTEIIDVPNRFGVVSKKPAHVAEYNKFMSGIDRSDQLISYYSCPKKTIRWYKKVLCHFIDMSVWNAFYLYKIIKPKARLLDFRNEVISKMLKVDQMVKPDFIILPRISPRKEVQNLHIHNEDDPDESLQQHFLEPIPQPTIWTRNQYYLKCRVCKKKNTPYRCGTCFTLPPLCVHPCFKEEHTKNSM